jgi:TonB-linked SusC/RagA family outer membrane protein
MVTVAYAGFSTIPSGVPKHPDGRYGGSQNSEDPDIWNAVKEAEVNYSPLARRILTSQGFFNLEIIDGLTLSGNAAFDFGNNHQKTINYPFEMWNFKEETVVNADYTMNVLERTTTTQKITLFSTLQYSKTIAGNHNVNAILGAQQEEYKMNWIQAGVDDFANPDIYALNAGLDVTSQTANGSGAEWALRSYFGRFSYNYMEKYLFEANARYDGSSRFNPDGRWSLFPSFSAGWRLSEENFMQNVGWIDYLKIRASWGQIGNNAIGNYAWIPTYAFNMNYPYDEQVYPGVAITSMTNEDIKWETTTVTDIGIDFTILDYRLSVSADYYFKRTNDILLQVPIPILAGNLASPVRNLGIVDNVGWDLEAKYHSKIGSDFRFGVGLNLTGLIKNEVVKYGDAPAITDYIIKEGYPAYAIYCYETDGIFQTQAEVDAYPTLNDTWGPGDFKFVDQLTVDTDGDGVPDEADGVIDGDDRVIMENAYPPLIFGLNLNFTWKSIDFFALFSGQYGSEQYNLDIQNVWFRYGSRGIFSDRYLDRWTPDNTDTDLPRLSNNNKQYSDFWVEDNSFVRLKNVQLGYTLPQTFTNKIWISKLRLYVNAQNLFTLTGWNGWDPERGLTQQRATYPVHRVVTFGVNVTF